jgi:DNA-binding transcriptional regulator YhcF (GntR family)
MQLRFSRHSEVSIREQLATQVVLAILSGELAPGQRLPSTRELARRFHVHPNTVSADRGQLERHGWLEFRKRSGVYVRSQQPAIAGESLALDRFIANFLRSARQLSVPLGTLRTRLRPWLELQPPDHFLLVEPDAALAEIISMEMRTAFTFPVHIADTHKSGTQADRCVPVALATSAKLARAFLPESCDLITLSLSSAQQSLAKYLPASNSVLVGIASGWPNFVKNARTMLIAAGFAPETLVLRDTSCPGWKRGIKQVAAVVCDSVSAQQLNRAVRVLAFPLLAESSLQDLKRYEQLIRSPLEP